jgi:segregation and condensation protein B
MKYSLKNTIECLLLVSDEPLSISQIIKILDDKNLNKKQISHAIDELNQDYANKAIHICHVASGFRFQAKDGLDAYISKLKDKGMNKFSKAFLETTAIIAYKQPVTRGDIEDIRGIAVSTNIIRALLELEWIKIVGHKESPGKPELFGTTPKFLDYFNKNKLSDLPEISDVESL